MADVFNATDGRNQFLEMFVAQVQHQDPLAPMDQSQILAQLAQFSQVESLETLNANFDSLLQAELQSQGGQLASTGAALLGNKVEFGESGSGIVDSVRQDSGQVLVEVDGQYIPLADISAIARNSTADQPSQSPFPFLPADPS